MAWPRIAEARKAKGWTQAELADRIGVAQAAVARWETGDIDIKSSSLVQLSSTLGVTISYILGYDLDDSGMVDLDPRSSELIGIYNKLDNESRDALMVVARALACASQGARTER